MTMKDYLKSAWTLHATDPKRVLEEVKQNFSLIETEADITALAHLITHVSGEHLGDWLNGLDLLKKLKNNALIKNKADMNRFVAILELGNNSATSIENFSPSDQVRILATTASALASLGGLKLAESYLGRAENLVQSLAKEDPANRALAVTGNTIASSLEEKKNRNANETELMIRAATIARKFWEIAGTWKEVERAEYRLSQSYLQADKLDLALTHAKTCLKIVAENNNETLEAFFGYEALVKILKARKEDAAFKSAVAEMTKAFNQLSADDQSWCKESLDKAQDKAQA